MRYFQLARVYSSLAVRAALPVGTPLYFGIFVVAFVVFGPTGMRAADLVFTLHSSPPFALVFQLGWLILTLAVARLALVPPSSSYLRWLPAPRSVLYAAAMANAFCVELPLGLLFFRGDGLRSGLSTVFGAMAVHAAAITRPFGYSHVFIGIGWIVATFVPQPWVALSVAFVSAAYAVKLAVDRAPEVHALARGKTRLRHPVTAMTIAHIRYVIRRESSVLGRLFVLSGLAGLCIPLAARGFDVETPEQMGGLVLVFSIVLLTPALSGLSGAVLRSERQTSWLADVLRTPARVRVFAAAFAASIVGTIGAVFLSLVASLRLPAGNLPQTLRVFTSPLVWVWSMGFLLTSLAREAEASPKRGDWAMVFVLVIVMVGLIACSFWGEKTLPAALFFAALSLFLAPERWLVLRRRRGTS